MAGHSSLRRSPQCWCWICSFADAEPHLCIAQAAHWHLQDATVTKCIHGEASERESGVRGYRGPRLTKVHGRQRLHRFRLLQVLCNTGSSFALPCHLPPGCCPEHDRHRKACLASSKGLPHGSLVSHRWRASTRTCLITSSSLDARSGPEATFVSLTATV